MIPYSMKNYFIFFNKEVVVFSIFRWAFPCGSGFALQSILFALLSKLISTAIPNAGSSAC